MSSENVLFIAASEVKIKEIRRLLMRYWGIPADRIKIEPRKEFRGAKSKEKAIVYYPQKNPRLAGGWVRNFASRSLTFLEGYDWGRRKEKRKPQLLRSGIRTMVRIMFPSIG